MNWTGPAELRGQVQKLWERGDLLASRRHRRAAFPAPADAARPGLAGDDRPLRRSARLDRRTARAAALPGRDARVPAPPVRRQRRAACEVWIDSLDDALALIGKRRDASRFGTLLELTRVRQPQLLAWLAKRPLRALELAEEWRRLLDIVAWLQAILAPASICGRWISPACTASSSKPSAACSASCSISRCRPRRSIHRLPG
jgi:hypothetical protein